MEDRIVLRVHRRAEESHSHHVQGGVFYMLYENICILCNPGVKEGKKVTPPDFPPSIYVGETARSLFERGKEHWRGFREKVENSHINKHHVIHHGGVGEPAFHLRPIKFFRTALSRQISEAVWIQRLGEDKILNSKAEFNRCKIGNGGNTLSLLTGEKK